MKQAFKRAVGTTPLWELAGLLRRGGCAVLTYHRVGANKQRFKHITADAFRQQMRWLQEHCSIVAPSDFRDACARRDRLRPAVLVTFDDGYRDYHDVAYPILRELGIPAVNFVATAFVERPGSMFWWDQVDLAVRESSRARVDLFWRPGERVELDGPGRERLRMDLRRYIWSRPDDERESTLDDFCDALGVRRAGLRIDRQVMTWDEIRSVGELTTIGAHTHTHPLVSRIDEPRLRTEIATCRDLLTARWKPPTMFAYPSGDVSNDAKRVLREEGFEIAFGGERGVNDARTDWLEAKRINAAPDARQLAYLLSGIPARFAA